MVGNSDREWIDDEKLERKQSDGEMKRVMEIWRSEGYWGAKLSDFPAQDVEEERGFGALVLWYGC